MQVRSKSAKVGRIWVKQVEQQRSKLGNKDRNRATLNRNRHAWPNLKSMGGPGPNRATLKRKVWADPGQLRTKSEHVRPHIAQVWPHLSPQRPKSCHAWPNSPNHGRARAKFGQTRIKLLPSNGLNQAKVNCDRPNLIELGPNLADFGTTSTDSGPISADPGHTSLWLFVEFRPNFVEP